MFKKIIIVLIITNSLVALWFFRGFLADVFVRTEKTVIEIDQEPTATVLEEGNEAEVVPKEKKVIAVGDIKTALKVGSEIVYYNRNNFLKTDSNGSYNKTLSSYPFSDLVFAKCAETGKFCLVKANEKFSVYNLESNQNIELEGAIRKVEFNSQGDGLIYLFFENGEYQLNSSNLDGKNWVRLKKIQGKNIDISVSPKGDGLVYFSKKANQEQSGLFLTNLTDQNQAQRIVKDDIIDVSWSPSGNRILFSFYDHSVVPKRVQLGYYDLVQKEQYALGLPGLAQKCVWSDDSKFLYCAILTTTTLKEFDLDDWYSGKFSSKDLFWKIDLKSGQKERLFSDFEKYPAVNAFDLILFGEQLIFVDKLSGNLIAR